MTTTEQLSTSNNNEYIDDFYDEETIESASYHPGMEHPGIGTHGDTREIEAAWNKIQAQEALASVALNETASEATTEQETDTTIAS